VESVLCAAVRYFVVEDHILNTTSGLVTQVYLDELWDLALSKIIPVLRIHIVSNCTLLTVDVTQRVLSEIKSFVVFY